MKLLILVLLVLCSSTTTAFSLRNPLNSPTSKKDPTPVQYSVGILEGINEISRDGWNNLLPADVPDDCCSPFLQHDWLNCLEKSQCASQKKGWQALHILVYKEPDDKVTPTTPIPKTEDDIVAALPMYVKYHSQGEFIFDHSWADFAERVLKIRYYPKLLSAIPFTPATTPKILLNPKHLPDSTDDKQAKEALSKQLGTLIATFIKQLTLQNKLSSVNLNYIKADEVTILQESDFSLRQTIQYRFTNFNNATGEMFDSFDDYLSQFKSKRRIKIKAERRKVYEDQMLTVRVINGADPEADAAFYQTMFELYSTTIEKMWGSQYLNSEFFQCLHEAPEEFRRNLVFIVAFDENILDKPIAGTFNMISGSHFYGRYWGAFEYKDNLHFEVCYYKAIDFCIDNRIRFMEPGAGGGSFKFLRGFDPYIVNSMHWFSSNELGTAVDDFLAQERKINQDTKEVLMDMSQGKKALRSSDSSVFEDTTS